MLLAQSLAQDTHQAHLHHHRQRGLREHCLELAYPLLLLLLTCTLPLLLLLLLRLEASSCQMRHSASAPPGMPPPVTAVPQPSAA
jgi:hypothetical protein